MSIKDLMSAILFFCVLVPGALIHGQQSFGGGDYSPEKVPCITEKQSAHIIEILKASSKVLEQKGMLPPINLLNEVKFVWPVRLATTQKDPSFFGISNYVDNNPAVPNQLLDYNCGQRTYDLSGGYNHRGIDIFSWPLSQRRQQQNAVEIIAAAPGVILEKFDGQPDNNCGFCSNCNWNAVYVLHSNGSVAWYGHLKSGSLTPKVVGATVEAGEYLGVMGSSGSSTGPHLHFEVWSNQNYTQLVDPFAGPCNSFNGNTSWWQQQRAYRRQGINKIMTGNAPFQNGTCPQLETPNDRNVFAPGATVYFTNFFQDQTQGMETVYKIFQPNGEMWRTWSHQSPGTYNASWWWWSWTLPSSSPGYWIYEASIPATGQVVRHTFYVGNTPPITTVNPGSFTDPAVWSGGTVPGENDAVFICHPVTVTSNRQLQSLVVNEGGQVIVPENVSLRVGNAEFRQMHSKLVD